MAVAVLARKFGVTVDSTHGDHHEVGDRESGIDVAREVGAPGRVEEVDAVGHAVGCGPLERSEVHGVRLLGARRFGVGVEQVPGRGLGLSDEGSGAHEQGLGEGGGAGTGVADQRDVADAGGVDGVHEPIVRTSGLARRGSFVPKKSAAVTTCGTGSTTS